MADEETYSLIFSSLKHPIRRKILRMLRDSELTFSQILEILSIDSGHLSYHLENLGNLVTHSSDGKYKLSSFGEAAVRLMSGVEEYTPPTASKPKSKVDTAVKIFSIVIAVALLWASLYSINSTTRTNDEFVGVPGISLALASNQTFRYNVSLTYGNYTSVVTGQNGLLILINEPPNTMNEWTKYYLWLDFEFNKTYDIILRVRDPSARVISWAPLRGSPGKFGVGPGAYLSQLGTYQVEIQNAQTEWLYGNMTLHVRYELFQRPLFYYGLAGIVTVFLYPVIIFSSWFWMKKAKLVKTT